MEYPYLTIGSSRGIIVLNKIVHMARLTRAATAEKIKKSMSSLEKKYQERGWMYLQSVRKNDTDTSRQDIWIPDHPTAIRVLVRMHDTLMKFDTSLS